MRRLQGLCLLCVGVALGFSAGAELRWLSQQPGGTWRQPDSPWFAMKLLVILGVLFLGLVFLVGYPFRRHERDEPAAEPAKEQPSTKIRNSPTRPSRR